MRPNGGIERADDRGIATLVRPQIEYLLSALGELPISELPVLLGELELACATLKLRMLKAQPHIERQEAHEENVSVSVGAKRLGTSTKFIYRHKDRLPFVRREGRKVLCNSKELDAYIAARRPATRTKMPH